MLASKARHSTTSSAELLEIIKQNSPASVDAALNPKLGNSELLQLINNPLLQHYAAFNPNCPQPWVDQHITSKAKYWAAKVNASDAKLFTFVMELSQDPERAEELAQYLSNKNLSATSLERAVELLTHPKVWNTCMPVICSHPNFPAELANDHVQHALNMSVHPKSFRRPTDEFILRAAGHPDLDPELQDRLIKRYHWDAYRSIALTDRVVESISEFDIQLHASEFEPADARIFDRLAEVKAIDDLTWRILVSDSTAGAGWATTSPHAPQGLTAPYIAERLVTHQALLCEFHPEIRNNTSQVSKWTELTDQQREPYPMPYAVRAKADYQLEGFALRVITNDAEFLQLSPEDRLKLGEFLQMPTIAGIGARKVGAFRHDAFQAQTLILVEATYPKDPTQPVGYSLIVGRDGEFTHRASWAAHGTMTDHRQIAFLSSASVRLAGIWDEVQRDYVTRNVSPPGPSLT